MKNTSQEDWNVNPTKVNTSEIEEVGFRLFAWREVLKADIAFILDAGTGLVEVSSSIDCPQADYVHDDLVAISRGVIFKARAIVDYQSENFDALNWVVACPIFVGSRLTKVLGFGGFSEGQELSDRALTLLDTFSDWLGAYLFRTSSSERVLADAQRVRSLLNATSDAVFAIGVSGSVTFINAQAERLIGENSEAAFGRGIDDLAEVLDEDGQAISLMDLSELVKATGSPMLINGTIKPSHSSDAPIRIDGQLLPMRFGGHQDLSVVFSFRDVEATSELQQKLVWQFSHDQLTGLKNRLEMESRLASALDKRNGSVVRASFIHLGIDGLEMVNNQFGPSVGDQLIKSVANMVKDLSVDGGHTVARIGGDEFGVLMDGADLRLAGKFADRLIGAMNGLFEWAGESVDVTLSAGVVPLRASLKNGEDVLLGSSMALRLAKENGRGEKRVLRSVKEVTTTYGDIHTIGFIKRAIEEKRIVLLKQRIAALPSAKDKRDHYEIFVRIKSETGKIVTPDKFIPAAERNNLMPQVDKAIFLGALASFSRFSEEDVLAINLSGKTVSYPGILDFFESAIKKSGVDPKRICFEVTETAAISNEAEAIVLLNGLKSLGSMISLDDFGAGHHTPSLMKAISPEYVKIDGAFVRQMFRQDGFDEAVIKSIVDMANKIGAEVIAESVEDEKTLEALRRLGVSHVQGYHIHKPELIG